MSVAPSYFIGLHADAGPQPRESAAGAQVLACRLAPRSRLANCKCARVNMARVWSGISLARLSLHGVLDADPVEHFTVYNDRQWLRAVAIDHFAHGGWVNPGSLREAKLRAPE